MPQLNTEYVKELLQAVNKSPFPKHISMTLTSIGLDYAKLELYLSTSHLQLAGIVHGGVLATLIDTATFWAVFMRIPEGATLVNVDLKLNYLKSAVSGTLFAEGRCLRAGRTLGYAEAWVKNETGDLLVHGTSTLMILPGKGMQLKAKKFLTE